MAAFPLSVERSIIDAANRGVCSVCNRSSLKGSINALLCFNSSFLTSSM